MGFNASKMLSYGQYFTSHNDTLRRHSVRGLYFQTDIIVLHYRLSNISLCTQGENSFNHLMRKERYFSSFARVDIYTLD